MTEKMFEGKNVIVTGASRGLGQAIAASFAGQGANLVISARKMPALEQAAQELSQAGTKVVPVAANAGNVEQINTLVETAAKELGSIDILINNAATNPVFGPAMFCEEWAWDKIMEVNLKGYFFMAKACLPHMQTAGEGSIVNVSSLAGFTYAQGMGPYSISKAGVNMLTKALAAEWATFNIRVNGIAPGVVKTQFAQMLWSTDDIMEKILDQQSIKRLAEPEDIVGTALYLAGPMAKFVTGQTIIVDGGSYV
jgi:NAD(P)-dependent dehydrogenase (short-subunit alcohol dehydrogenase family)